MSAARKLRLGRVLPSWSALPVIAVAIAITAFLVASTALEAWARMYFTLPLAGVSVTVAGIALVRAFSHNPATVADVVVLCSLGVVATAGLISYFFLPYTRLDPPPTAGEVWLVGASTVAIALIGILAASAWGRRQLDPGDAMAAPSPIPTNSFDSSRASAKLTCGSGLAGLLLVVAVFSLRRRSRR